MRSTSESITYPLLRQRGEWLLMGWILLTIGLVLDAELVMEPLGLLFLGPLALGLTLAGAAMLLTCQMRLHLVPEGAAVSLFGRTLRRYPAEELGLICRYDHRTTDGMVYRYLCICATDIPGLAAMRERKLRRSKFYRDGVDRRKARGDWELSFAMEQLRGMTRLNRVLPARKWVLCLEDEPITAEFLKRFYPEIPWLDRRKEHTRRPYSLGGSIRRKLDAETPADFLRSCPDVVEAIGMQPLLVTLIPMLVLVLAGFLLLCVSEWLGIAVMALAMIWLFGSLIVLERRMGGKERLSLTPEGIHVRPKGREAVLIPAQSLRTLWRFQMNAKGGPIRYLAVSARTVEELARMEETDMETTRRGREELEAFRLCDSWQAIAAHRQIRRRMLRWGYGDRELLLIAHTGNREQWLRERYPHLELHEIDD